jgi:imidazolonepropionase-like amidohydrolase
MSRLGADGAAVAPARASTLAALAAFAVAVTVSAWPAPASAQIAVRGGTVYTMAGAPIRDGIVLVENGKVAQVGPATSVRVPDGVRVVEAAVVTPGLVDAHTVIGMAGYLNIEHDQDQLDRGEAIQPELRAIDGFNIREPLVDWVRGLGVTTIHTGHGPGTIVSGQTMVVKTWGRNVEGAVLDEQAMVAATLGGGAIDSRPGKSPGTRAKALAMLRAKLVEAQQYARKQKGKDESKRPGRDLRLEALNRVLSRELPLLVTVHRHQDILAALRLAREFELSLVLDGAAEAHVVLDEIRAAGIPVILHPTMTRAGRAGGDGETENVSMETAARLQEAGIRFAIQSGYESYVPKTRVVLFEAGVATAFGLSTEQALAAVTIEAARIVGVADRVGSLERGKDGDLALFDGDPFEYTTHCVGVVIDGVQVEDQSR